MTSRIERLQEKALQGAIDTDDAMELYSEGVRNPFRLFAAAADVRDHFKGRNVSLCAIINAKSGICPENCGFCAQSAHHETGAPVYPLVGAVEIIEKAHRAKELGAHYFGIVTSGTSVADEAEWNTIYSAAGEILRLGIKPCGSLGMLNIEQAVALKEAGLFRYHHNLETSKSFFPHICSTHEYAEDIVTVKAAKAAGLSVCSGGIIGLGETMEQRVEMAMTLKELDVDSVPVNILNPIYGTPLASTPPLAPMEILITIALFRFILPYKDIKLCGGKEKNLRQLLPLAIVAGCNSFMTGNYLTTGGRNTTDDLEMIKDLGLLAAETG
ncbi:MAG: biotin synthase BioB [Syntrophobacterales bacterium]|nr:biotin synthase BioB [Syntrophobacterales bacterium]